MAGRGPVEPAGPSPSGRVGSGRAGEPGHVGGVGSGCDGRTRPCWQEQNPAGPPSSTLVPFFFFKKNSHYSITCSSSSSSTHSTPALNPNFQQNSSTLKVPVPSHYPSHLIPPNSFLLLFCFSKTLTRLNHFSPTKPNLSNFKTLNFSHSLQLLFNFQF